MTTIWKHLRDAWLILGLTLLLFGLVEVAFAMFFTIKDRLSPPALVAASPPVLADAVGTEDWVAQYGEEFERSSAARWEPYLYWRRKPFKGDLINVDDAGVRRTAQQHATPPDSHDPKKIYMFGGSTMWGTGARDAFTIPSILAAELARRGLAVQITNFGESGYVSTQEVVALLLQLQSGERPDLVIFYDGVNDMFSAYQQQVAGIPQNEFNRAEEFNLSQPEKLRPRVLMTLRDFARGLAMTRSAKWLVREAGRTQRPLLADRRAPGSAGDPQESTLARNVIDVYRGNIELVRALGSQYRFRHLFYWQPTLFEKPHRTEHEESGLAKVAPVAAFAREVRQELQGSDLPNASDRSFADLGLLFADIREPVFIDWCHVGESGNESIAIRMAEDVFSVLAGEHRPAEPSAH